MLTMFSMLTITTIGNITVHVSTTKCSTWNIYSAIVECKIYTASNILTTTTNIVHGHCAGYSAGSRGWRDFAVDLPPPN